MGNSPADRGLDRFTVIDTRDVDLTREAVRSALGDLALDVHGDARRFSWRATLVKLGPLVLVHGPTGGDVSLHGAPAGHTLSLADDPGVDASSAGGDVRIAPGRAVAMYSAGAPSRWRATSEVVSTTLRLDPAFVEGQLAALTGAPVRGPLRFELAQPAARRPGAR
jgi:hypothetical protein